MTAKDESSEPAWTTVVFKKISTSSREIGISVTSETFKHEDTSWKVNMFIGGETEQSKNHCSIYLYSSSALKASFSMKLVNLEHEKKSKRVGPAIHFFKANTGYGCQTFTTTDHLLDPINGFLLNDTVTIQVQK
jgi:hypothetical protein